MLDNFIRINASLIYEVNFSLLVWFRYLFVLFPHFTKTHDKREETVQTKLPSIGYRISFYYTHKYLHTFIISLFGEA